MSRWGEGEQNFFLKNERNISTHDSENMAERKHSDQGPVYRGPSDCLE